MLPGYVRAVRLLTKFHTIMTKETFDKKLAFTIESVEKNQGYVSGIIAFSDGGYVTFDEDYVEMVSNDGSTVWESDAVDCDIRNVIQLLYGINAGIVERVYPDCC